MVMKKAHSISYLVMNNLSMNHVTNKLFCIKGTLQVVQPVNKKIDIRVSHVGI